MAKKFFSVLLCICGYIPLRAQTINVADMMSIMNLREDEATGYLTSKGFKLKVIQQINGFKVNQFEYNQHGKLETVVWGQNSRAVDGTILHTIRYSTNTAPYITNLVTNASNSGLKLDFQGADNFKNIYFYNSVLYRASIYLNFNKAYGLVEIREKDLSGG